MRTYVLEVLNLLMNADDYLTTLQICDKVGCHRKSIPFIMDQLECSGFGIDVIRCDGHQHNQNKYKYVGLYGLSGDD